MNKQLTIIVKHWKVNVKSSKLKKNAIIAKSPQKPLKISPINSIEKKIDFSMISFFKIQKYYAKSAHLTILALTHSDKTFRLLLKLWQFFRFSFNFF